MGKDTQPALQTWQGWLCLVLPSEFAAGEPKPTEARNYFCSLTVALHLAVLPATPASWEVRIEVRPPWPAPQG